MSYLLYFLVWWSCSAECNVLQYGFMLSVASMCHEWRRAQQHRQSGPDGCHMLLQIEFWFVGSIWPGTWSNGFSPQPYLLCVVCSMLPQYVVWIQSTFRPCGFIFFLPLRARANLKQNRKFSSVNKKKKGKKMFCNVLLFFLSSLFHFSHSFVVFCLPELPVTENHMENICLFTASTKSLQTSLHCFKWFFCLFVSF